MRAVLDANVAVSAVGWDGEAFLCLVKMARRQLFAYGTEQTLDETRDFHVKRTNSSPTIPVPSSPSLVRQLKATAKETELSQADVIRQSLKLGMAALRARLGKAPRRHLPLWEHFRRLKGLELPPWLD